MGHRGAEQEVALGRGDLEQTQRVGGRRAGRGGSGGAGRDRGTWVCLGEEGTHRSSLGELQPPAPQPTGPCGSHQSSHPSADCIQLKIAPWEERSEEEQDQSPLP